MKNKKMWHALCEQVGGEANCRINHIFYQGVDKMLTFPSLLNLAHPAAITRVAANVNPLFADQVASHYPQVGLWANGEEALVRAELPGFSSGDIEVEVKENVLRLSGERAGAENDKEYVRKERFSGRFDRRVRLPYAVDAEKVAARFSNGVLEVKLPRVEADKPRKIAIEA
jgi:HSP20 family protein